MLLLVLQGSDRGVLGHLAHWVVDEAADKLRVGLLDVHSPLMGGGGGGGCESVTGYSQGCCSTGASNLQSLSAFFTSVEGMSWRALM
jgi:hypothetical protein